MSYRDYLHATVAEVEQWPGARVKFDMASKHAFATISFRAASRSVFFPVSPSDSVRGLKNHIGTVRAVLRNLGAVRDVPLRSTGPKRKRMPVPLQPHRVAADAPEPTDWRDALKGIAQ